MQFWYTDEPTKGATEQGQNQIFEINQKQTHVSDVKQNQMTPPNHLFLPGLNFHLGTVLCHRLALNLTLLFQLEPLVFCHQFYLKNKKFL